MNAEAQQKVTARHLKRNAYLYVRQSTMRQVVENTFEHSAPVRTAPARRGARLAR
jgi:hypothetical protein